MRNNLDLLLSEGIIDEVLGRLQGGKEADVFRVRYRGEVVAAKVYKDREHRSFKHNAAYKEGRKVRNSRTQRAMDKGSRFGRDEAEDAWKASEAKALHLLHGHGVRVPNPVMFYEGVLLMELVTDADGDAAPRLIDAPIAADQAGALYRDLRGQIVGMLCCDLIHGDLSPYNVLLGAAGPTIIDLPQTISAAHNTQSEHFFRRDLDNIQRFFAALDRRLGAHGGDAREIWRAYARRELTPDFVPAMMAREERRPPPPVVQGARGVQGTRAWSPREAAPAPHAQPQRGPQAHAQPQRGPQAQPQRGYGYVNAPGRPGPRPPQQAARGPVEVYVKRTGMRESAPRVEPTTTPPVQPAQRTPEAPRPEGGEGRRGHGRRR
jgi:RIO kinase 1